MTDFPAIASTDKLSASLANIKGRDAYIADLAALARFLSDYSTIQAPAKVLDFRDGQAADNFTINRASTEDTRYDRRRLMSTVAANAAQYDHNPTTGEPRGVFLSVGRTNLCADPDDLTGAAWTNSGTPVTSSSSVPSSKSGVNLNSVEDDDGAVSESRRQIVDLSAFSAGDVLVCSMEVKKTDATVYPAVRALVYDTGVNKLLDVAILPFNTAYPSFDITGAADLYGTEDLGDGLKRAYFVVTLPSPVSGTLDYIDFRAFPSWRADDLGRAADGTQTGTNHFGNACVCEGAAITPFFGTGASQVSLNDAFMELDPTAEDWWNNRAPEGTLLIEADLDFAALNSGFIQLREAYNTGGGFFFRCTTTGDGLEGRAGAVRGDAISFRLTPTASEFSEALFNVTLGAHKIAIAWQRDGISVTVDGATVINRTLNTDFPDDFASFRINGGNSSNAHATGTYKRVAYWPARLDDADLVTLTT